jgi:cytidylate kinase
MPVITIRGQYGSWATEIGKLIAHKLNIDYVDREIIARVAEQLHEPRDRVKEKETPPTTPLGRIAEAMGSTYMGDGGHMGLCVLPWEIPLNDRIFLSGLEHIIKELAKSEAIVIRGRGSQFILKDFPGAFHVLVVASIEVRVKRVMERLKLNERDARKEIARFDNGIRGFIERYFQADITDPINYDIVVNTNRLSVESAASIIVESLPYLAVVPKLR